MIRVLLLILFFHSSAFAGDLENDRLARIQREIALLVQLVEDTEGVSVERNEAMFRYDLLIGRLHSLRQDIQSHINYVNNIPKTSRFVVQ